MTLLHGQTASAAVTNAPDPNFYTPNGSDVLLVASKAGTNSGGTYNALESPVIVVMAYFDNPTGNSITVWNGDSPCGIPGNGTGVDGTVEGPTAFAFLDVAANSYTNIVGSGSMGCGNYTVNLPTLQPYTIPGSGGQQKYVVKVTATNTTVGTINAFRVSMPAGKGVMSFYDQSSRQFAIQDRANWGPSPGNETRFDLPFAPSCTFNSSGEVSLLWRDDDQGQSNQGPNMRMRLLEDGVDITGQQPVPVFKGANADGSWKVTVKPGKKYIWRWEGVSERNGIQFQLPFDSFYYTFDCHPVTPVVDVSAVCSEGKLKFRVSDPTNTHYDARLRWDGQNINGSGSDSLLQDLTPGNSPGIHVYEFDVSDYADFGTHTVGVRIKSGNDPAFNYDSPTKIGPCATISCTSTSFEPNTPTPGEPFHMTSAISTTIGP
ncbi:hypothetical protein KC957_01790, partial [Candidatus Saccharibacteria bacterium]|nr:hypothetical protein [Candidatus Saccharibacteria bacterium]